MLKIKLTLIFKLNLLQKLKNKLKLELFLN